MTAEALHLREQSAGFFDQDLETVDAQLQGRWVIVSGTGKAFKIVETKKYPKVGDRYAEISGLKPGELWSPPARGIQQSLVVVKPVESPGSCIRILRAEYRLPNGEVVQTKAEGELAKYLGLAKDGHYQLALDHETKMLHLQTFFQVFGQGNKNQD